MVQPLLFKRDHTGSVGVHVGHLPGRKSACVSIIRGSVMDTVAYCRSDEDAVRLQQALADLLGVELPPADPTQE